MHVHVSIPEAFGYSLLGLAVVFAVLIFLMFIVWLMSRILRPKTLKTSAAADIPALAAAADALAIEAAAPPAAEAPAAAVAEAVAEATAEPAQKRFRVVINGVDHIVDAEMRDSTAGGAK